MKGPKKKKPTRRDFIELAIILVVFAVIYLTGSQAKVFGKVQQAVLYTGIMNARELDEMAIKEANYNFKFTNESGQIVSAQTLKGKTVFMNNIMEHFDASVSHSLTNAWYRVALASAAFTV